MSNVANEQAGEDVWRALRDAGAFVEGNFTLASGKQATLKVEAEQLYDHPKQLGVVLGHVAMQPCVREADVLLYVPDGWRKFTELLALELDKPLAHSQRKPGATSRYEFEFATDMDRSLAMLALRPCINEDVVTTLGSVAGMRSLLRPDQHVSSLAVLRRGVVKPAYQAGLRDYYLLEREIPTDKDEFHARYSA